MFRGRIVSIIARLLGSATYPPDDRRIWGIDYRFASDDYVIHVWWKLHFAHRVTESPLGPVAGDRVTDALGDREAYSWWAFVAGGCD